jgi:hypothetical protein
MHLAGALSLRYLLLRCADTSSRLFAGLKGFSCLVSCLLPRDATLQTGPLLDIDCHVLVTCVLAVLFVSENLDVLVGSVTDRDEVVL